MSALDLTTGDLSRLLGQIAGLSAVDEAVRARAEALAGTIEAEGADARVIRHGPGDYEVAASAPNLFAREFGALDGTAEPLVAPAIARLAVTGS